MAAQAFSNVVQQAAAHLHGSTKLWAARTRATVRSEEFTARSASPLIFGTQRSERTSLRKLCSIKCWMQGILIFSGCISTEELWMATNCSYYANETAHLEIAYVALLKMQELLVCKVQFNKPSLLKTFKPQNTESLLLVSHCTWLQVGGNQDSPSHYDSFKKQKNGSCKYLRDAQTKSLMNTSDNNQKKHSMVRYRNPLSCLSWGLKCTKIYLYCKICVL